MEFFVRAYDGTDEGAVARRDAARPEHRVVADKLSANGTYLYTAAIVDASGRITGSILVCDFPSRKELDAWLAVEPFVTRNVWQKVEVELCKPGLAFGKNK